MFAEDVGPAAQGPVQPDHRRLGPRAEEAGRLPRPALRRDGEGGNFGLDPIPYFNGNLFDDAAVVHPTPEEMLRIKEAARLDWGQIDPSIFGTLFERGMDPAKRSQLGLHYTSREDIETLIEPVLMQPLRREWAEVRGTVEALVADAEPAPPSAAKTKPRPGRQGGQSPDALIRDFLQRLQSVTVLDPSCGSGNFLYVALQKLKDLEKEVLVFASDRGLGAFLPLVGPRQLHGIEVNPYAHDLAQMSVWIGYLQWQRANGFRTFPEPILQRLDTIECKDAVLDLTDPANPKEPDWPEAEFIVGNPPFLGEQADAVANWVMTTSRPCSGLCGDRVRPESDLCCYWFEKARSQIEAGKCRRAGPTGHDRASAGRRNRRVLEADQANGRIFFAESGPRLGPGRGQRAISAWSDSMKERTGRRSWTAAAVARIHTDLTPAATVDQGPLMPRTSDCASWAIPRCGAFDIDDGLAIELLTDANPTAVPTATCSVRSAMAADLVRRSERWIIDFGVAISRARCRVSTSALLSTWSRT